MSRPANPATFLTGEEKQKIAAAIRQTEQQTSAEMKVVILRHCWKTIRRKAEEVFHHLHLDRTRQRNGVLILLVTTNQEFLLYGDQGIHEKVGPDFWNEVRDQMLDDFRRQCFGRGLENGILLIGEKLAAYFPRRQEDTDELSNDITCLE